MTRSLLFLCAVLVAMALPAAAKQDDDRLEPLFEQLLTVDDKAVIVATERQIWGIWHESGSDTIDLLMQSGIHAMNRGDHAEAVEQFTAVVEIAPKFAEGWNKRATAHYLAGDYDASVADIAKTLELEPRHFGALSGLGLIYDAIDQPEGALRAYRRALAVHPHLQHPRRRVEALKKELKDRNI